MRLINADDIVYESIDSSDTCRHERYYGTGILAVRKEDIDAMQTIEECKKGKWLDGHRAGYGETLYWYIYCSECLYERDDDDHDKDTPFCPNCGCAMTEEGEQE